MAKKEKGTALVNWDKQFAELAKKSKEGIKVSVGRKFLSFKGGLYYDGIRLEDDELRCVIIGWIHHNTYYDPSEPYDADNPQTPICYSFGHSTDEMEPAEDVADAQNDECASCPLNQYRKEKGKQKGKGCKNTFRIALISEAELDNVETAEIVYASIPPTSLKYFANYVGKELDKYGRPFWSMVTLLKWVPDSKSQFLVTFSPEERIENSKYFKPLMELHEKTTDELDFGYEAKEKEEPAPKKAKAKKTTNKFSRK